MTDMQNVIFCDEWGDLFENYKRDDKAYWWVSARLQ